VRDIVSLTSHEDRQLFETFFLDLDFHELSEETQSSLARLLARLSIRRATKLKTPRISVGMLHKMPKSTTTCPVCGKTDIRADNLKRHMDANHKGQQPAPTNRVVMEEDSLLEAAAATAASIPPSHAATKAAKKDLERLINHTADALEMDKKYPMKDFVAAYKTRSIAFAKNFHQDIWGTKECNERCAKCHHRTYCDGVFDPTLSMYSISKIEGMYRMWVGGMKRGLNNIDALAHTVGA